MGETRAGHPRSFPPPGDSHLGGPEEGESLTIGKHVFLWLSDCETVLDSNRDTVIPSPTSVIDSPSFQRLAHLDSESSGGSEGQFFGSDYPATPTPGSPSMSASNASLDLITSPFSRDSSSTNHSGRSKFLSPGNMVKGFWNMAKSSTNLSALDRGSSEESLIDGSSKISGPPISGRWIFSFESKSLVVTGWERKFDCLLIGEDSSQCPVICFHSRSNPAASVRYPKDDLQFDTVMWLINRDDLYTCTLTLNLVPPETPTSRPFHIKISCDSGRRANELNQLMMTLNTNSICRRDPAHGGPEQVERSQAVLEVLAADPANGFCADCNRKFYGIAEVFFSFGAWSLVCSECSGVHRSLSTKIKSFALDEWHPHILHTLKTCGNAFSASHWLAQANLEFTDLQLDCHEPYRPAEHQFLKEHLRERQIYRKYYTGSFMERASWSAERTQQSSVKLREMLMTHPRDYEEILKVVFEGATLLANDMEMVREQKKQMRENETQKDHEDILTFIETFSSIREQQERLRRNTKSKNECEPLKRDEFVSVYFACNYDGAKKQASFVPWKIPVNASSADACVKEPFEVESFNLNHYFEKVVRAFERSAPFDTNRSFRRPRKIGLLSRKQNDRFLNPSCVVLENTTLSIAEGSSGSEFRNDTFRHIDLMFLTAVERGQDEADSFMLEYIDCGTTVPEKLTLRSSSRYDAANWVVYLNDVLSTFGPQLTQQPLHRELTFNVTCNAVVCRVLDRLLRLTISEGARRHWLQPAAAPAAAAASLSGEEEHALCRICLQYDILEPQNKIFYQRLKSPTALLLLLVQFSRQFLLVPLYRVHALRHISPHAFQPRFSQISTFTPADVSAVKAFFSELLPCFFMTCKEIFKYFSLLIHKSTDISTEELSTWLSEKQFADGLFSTELISCLIDNCQFIFQISDSEWQALLTDLDRIGVLMRSTSKPKQTSIQVLHIRCDWSKYHGFAQEDSVPRIKYICPPDFHQLTNGEFFRQLCGQRSGTDEPECVDERGNPINPQEYLLFERLPADNCIFRVRPFGVRIADDPSTCTVLMNTVDLLRSFAIINQKVKCEVFFAADHHQYQIVTDKSGYSLKSAKSSKSRVAFVFDLIRSNGVADWDIRKLLDREDELRKVARGDSIRKKRVLDVEDFEVYIGCPQTLKTKDKLGLAWQQSLTLVETRDVRPTKRHSSADKHLIHSFVFDDYAQMIECYWRLIKIKCGSEAKFKQWIPPDWYSAESIRLHASMATSRRLDSSLSNPLGLPRSHSAKSTYALNIPPSPIESYRTYARRAGSYDDLDRVKTSQRTQHRISRLFHKSSRKQDHARSRSNTGAAEDDD